MQLVDSRPKLARKGDLSTDQLVTHCTNCERGIFRFHSYEWTRRGLVHIDCKNVAIGVMDEAKLST